MTERSSSFAHAERPLARFALSSSFVYAAAYLAYFSQQRAGSFRAGGRCCDLLLIKVPRKNGGGPPEI
jgi:hypothetical protein